MALLGKVFWYGGVLPDKEHRSNDQQERDSVIPTELRVEIQHGEDAEDDQRDDLLHDLQLDGRELRRAPAVGGNLETVLGKRDQPTDEDRDRQWRLLEFQVPVPREGHEDVGDRQQQNGEHLEVVSV